MNFNKMHTQNPTASENAARDTQTQNKLNCVLLSANPVSENHIIAMMIANTRFPALNKECVNAVQKPNVIILNTLYNGCHNNTCTINTATEEEEEEFDIDDTT